MSNQDQNQAENAYADEDILDGEAAFAMEEDAFLESMRKYMARRSLRTKKAGER